MPSKALVFVLARACHRNLRAALCKIVWRATPKIAAASKSSRTPSAYQVAYWRCSAITRPSVVAGSKLIKNESVAGAPIHRKKRKRMTVEPATSRKVMGDGT